MITFATGCSGIGAPEVAWGDHLRWKCLWNSEIDKFPAAVLKYHWPKVCNAGDFMALAARIESGELEAPDVFIAGTPCQAFSIAGLRESLNDHRGGLTLEYCRIADAMDNQRRRRGLPETVFVWENVPGVLTTKDNAFGCFLAAMSGAGEPLTPDTRNGKWTAAGVVSRQKRKIAWRILDAQYFGVAQRRRRMFVVATARAGFSPAEALFERGGVSGNPPPQREEGEEVASSVRGGAEGARGLGVVRAYALDALAGNSMKSANPHSGCREVDVAGCLDTGCLEPSRNQGGLAICIAENIIGRSDVSGANGVGVKEEQSFTLNAGGVQGVIEVYENHGQDSRVRKVDVATLNAKAGTGGGNLPLVLTTGQANAEVAENHCPTLNCNHEAPILCLATQQGGAEIGENYAPTLTSAAGMSGNNQPVVCLMDQGGSVMTCEKDITGTLRSQTHGHEPVIATYHIVRRLTPVECARLQAFPDHHTEIPWRGKPKEACPEAPQYKAYGNSMCVNVIEWIGKRIERELKK